MWAGIERDSLSFDEIRKLARGEVIKKTSKPIFFRNMTDLTLSISPVTANIKRATGKEIMNNEYKPQVVNLINFLLFTLL